MIKPGNRILIHCPENIQSTLPEEFGLLTWNAYKKNGLAQFKDHLLHIHQRHPTNILLLQEAAEPSVFEQLLPNYETLFFSNLKMKRKSFGVATASCTKHVSSSYLISHHQEFLLQTHKSLLISVYPLANKQQLVVVNIHAINFKNIKAYKHEINLLMNNILFHDGPLIISGDFNTWSKRRHGVIDMMMNELGLEKVEFEHSYNTKKFLKYPLDLTLCRGLKLNQAISLNCGKISDHNPLYARFSI